RSSLILVREKEEACMKLLCWSVLLRLYQLAFKRGMLILRDRVFPCPRVPTRTVLVGYTRTGKCPVPTVMGCRLVLGGLALILVACSLCGGTMSKIVAPHTVVVSGEQWGESTCAIGAVEGSSGFDIADLKDLGINTYHIYGGMPRWEAEDDSSVYGSPSIA